MAARIPNSPTQNQPSSYYDSLSQKSLAHVPFTRDEALDILTSSDISLLPLLNSAYMVRQQHWGNDVTIHVINNAQNGLCPEDCGYCAQAKTSSADIESYPAKEAQEIMDEAKQAYESGAYRYCMVFSGRGPRPKRVEQLATIIESIKSTYPIQVCLSAGLMDEAATKRLKAAGLDRLNHNLNSSESYYPSICTTHTFQDRMNTLIAAQKEGLEICSGMIVGLGEKPEDVVDVAFRLQAMGSKSIPINFYIPIEGTALGSIDALTPDYCLRVLCLFRLLNPEAEIRMAAGRELHLRSLQAFGLYPASSLFMDGYLNTKGTNPIQTLTMIKDAGFKIRSTKELDQLLERFSTMVATQDGDTAGQVIMKQLRDLRPACSI